jgi:hypothetical protein
MLGCPDVAGVASGGVPAPTSATVSHARAAARSAERGRLAGTVATAKVSRRIVLLRIVGRTSPTDVDTRLDLPRAFAPEVKGGSRGAGQRRRVTIPPW